jgi:uncharacterized phage protein (TIGR01671 family)
MRDFKFRAWVETEEFTGHFYEGDKNDVVSFMLYQGGWSVIDCNFNPLRDNEFIIEQYTGLKDKNGKEIYEGDIYTQGDPKIKYVVTFRKGAFVGKQLNNKSTAGLAYWIERIEVVGNIHEGTK